MQKEKQVLGFYDYTVILTYISLLISVGGIFLAICGYLKLSVTALALSGLCDMFDGKIARTKKNRTIDEQRFGVQIDSLCDMVCFGIAPAIICFQMGMNRAIGIVILMIFVLTGLIRLAFYNVITENPDECPDGECSVYHGLPITSSAIALPLVMMLRPLLRLNFIFVLQIVMLSIAVLYVTNFRLKKPTNAVLAVMVIIVGLAVLKLLHLC